MGGRGMRATWDALASADTETFVGDPGRGGEELEGLFGRLGEDPRGGTCLEVGCGPGRMTGALAERFDRVLAVDVSPAMVERARATVPAPNVEFNVVPGERLAGVADASADALVCYLVLQHLPRRALVAGYLREFARVLAPDGRAYVQLPLLAPGLRARAWRAARTLVVPLVERFSRNPTRAAAFRGFRLTEAELERDLAAAGLGVVGRADGPDAPYRHSHDLFLVLERA